jgi:preprotein translocase subunit SecF
MLKSISRFGFARNKWLYGGTVPGKAFKIRFYENRRIYFAISLGVIAVGLIANGIFGTKLDINFKGGAVIKYSYSGEVQPNKIEQAVEKAVNRDVSVTINKNVRSASGTGKANNITLSFAGRDSISPETQKAVNTALNQVYPDAKFTSIETSSINPSMGRTFFEKCIVAILIAFVLLDLYVALRFRRIGGAAAGTFAIVALLHDVAMVYFTFIIFRIPLDNNFIAVVLTILGYSLNDTIVVYDRIRENRRLYGPKTGYDVLANTSINQTFTRSLYTAGTTVLSVATVLVVGMFYNLSSITTFALPMMIGVISGCYSSVCIASPLFVMWENHKTKKLALQASKQQQVHAQLAPQSETTSPESAAVPKTTAAAAKKKSGKKNTHKAKKKKH